MNIFKVLFLYPFSEKSRFYWHYLVAKDYTGFLNEALSNKEKIMQSERFKKMAHPPNEKLMRFLPPDELDPIVREEKTFNRCYVDLRKSVIEKNLAKMKAIDPNSPFVFEIESQYFKTPQKDVPDTQMSSEIKFESKRPNPTTVKMFWLILFFISFGIYHFANKTFGIVLQSIIGLIFFT